MLPINGCFRLLSADKGCCLSAKGEPLRSPVPKEIVFDAAIDPLSSTLLLSTVRASRAFYRKALRIQLIRWAVVIAALAFSVFLSLQERSAIVGIMMMSPLIFFWDRIFNIPTRVLKDSEGNVLHVAAGYLVAIDGTQVALSEN